MFITPINNMSSTNRFSYRANPSTKETNNKQSANSTITATKISPANNFGKYLLVSSLCFLTGSLILSSNKKSNKKLLNESEEKIKDLQTKLEEQNKKLDDLKKEKFEDLKERIKENLKNKKNSQNNKNNTNTINNPSANEAPDLYSDLKNSLSDADLKALKDFYNIDKLNKNSKTDLAEVSSEILLLLSMLLS